MGFPPTSTIAQYTFSAAPSRNCSLSRLAALHATPAQIMRLTDRGILREGAAAEHDGPALVDIASQPLEEAAAPVSQWMG